MRIWLALIVVPLLALTDQAVAFALVHWACDHQAATIVHASHVAFLAIATGAAFGAWQTWRETAVVASSDSEAVFQLHFLAGVATMVASLSAIAIAAMWIPTWIISPCLA